MGYTIPILFIFFNRKDVSLITFAEIKKKKPLRLYLASDGPREKRPEENDLVNDIRSLLIGLIDWDCEVYTLFQSDNLGCGDAVSSAINWLFANEEMGVVIEDDCLVNNTFFEYMSELLIKYKDDNRIGFISGLNPLGSIPSNDSYCFSKYMFSWGWATWRRSWEEMDYHMSWRNTEHESSILNNVGYNGKCVKDNKIIIEYLEKKYINTWDYQWRFTLAALNQLCILPSVNLVSNIGTGKDATHTSYSDITLSSKAMVLPLIHPKYVLSNSKMDFLIYKSQNTLFQKVFNIIPYPFRKFFKGVVKLIK